MKLAAIDIGTNSIHLVIVQADARGGFDVVDREKSMVKLGLGLFASGRLTERAFDEGVQTITRFCRLAESRGVDEILAVATSATREAENGGEFLDAVFAHSGVAPRLISGAEEARLILQAVRHAVPLAGKRALVLDIGGGSVETTVGDEHTLLLAESLRLGVLRLLDRQGGPGRLATRQVRDLQRFIFNAASDTFKQIRELKPNLVVGTSGTVRALSEAAHLDAKGEAWRSSSAQVVSRAAIEKLAKVLVDLDAAKRAQLPGISEPRADAIHLGAVLLVELLRLAQVESFTLCDASLREGVIVDYLEKHGAHARPRASSDPRRRSVVELMRKCGRDDPREGHVARLARDLFDRTQILHGLGAQARELLEYAALLSGVGQLISHHNRHLHAQYVVTNSALRGFSDDEVALLGLILRYQRGTPPRRRDLQLAGLDKATRRLTRVLAAILRVVLAADRGHTQVVKGFACRLVHTRLELTLIGSGDHLLEHWAVARQLAPLAKALRCRVQLVAPLLLGPVVPSYVAELEHAAADVV